MNMYFEMNNYMSKFVNEFQLMNPTSKDIVSENCLLTTLCYRNVAKVLGFEREVYRFDAAVRKWLEACKTDIKGLYHQYPKHYMDGFVHNEDKWTSPDQLIAMHCWYILLGMKKEAREVRFYLIKNFFTYDNIGKDLNFKRIMQPMAVFTVLSCGDLSKFLFFIPTITTCLWADGKSEHKTSGKQKSFVIQSSLYSREYSLKDFIEFHIEPLKIYYKEPDHPIRILIGKYDAQQSKNS